MFQKKGWDFIPDLLVRKKDTKPQIELRGIQRVLNIKDVFLVNESCKIPKKVVIFDDVWTTGSTIKEAVKTLKEKGVDEVFALTIARR